MIHDIHKWSTSPLRATRYPHPWLVKIHGTIGKGLCKISAVVDDLNIQGVCRVWPQHVKFRETIHSMSSQISKRQVRIIYKYIYIYLQTSKHKCAFMYDKVLLYDNMVYVPCPEHVKTKYVKVLYMAMVRHCIMGILALAILNPC